MKHAHPMITPLKGVDASAVLEDFEEDSARLFDLLTQAVGKHVRAQEVFLVEQVVSQEGDMYLRGTSHGSCERDLLQGRLGGLNFEGVRQRRHEDEPSIDALLEWIAAGRLMSPARMAEVFDELEAAGWVDICNERVEITEPAKALIAHGSQYGWDRLNANAFRRWRSSCDECVSGCSDLDQLFGKAEELFGLELTGLAEQVRVLTSAALE